MTLKLTDGSEKIIRMDEDGFIREPGEWCKEFAVAIAGEESISSLTDDHWKVINYLRDYYLKFDSCPPIRMVCRQASN